VPLSPEHATTLTLAVSSQLDWDWFGAGPPAWCYAAIITNKTDQSQKCTSTEMAYEYVPRNRTE
jgi:hypothetical protein